MWYECCIDAIDSHCRDLGQLSKDRTVWRPDWDVDAPDEVNLAIQPLRPVLIIEQDEVIYKSNDDTGGHGSCRRNSS